MTGLLGVAPSRNFKIYRTDFPAIFRFNGHLFMEVFDIEGADDQFVTISEEHAMQFLEAKAPEVGSLREL